MKFVIKESQLNLLTESLSFREVYKDTFPTIFNSVCMKFAKGDYDLAQEYCQIGFIKVYNQLDKFRGESSIKTWVHRVVTNTIITSLRTKKSDIIPDDSIEIEKLGIIDEPTEKEDEIDYMGKYSKKDLERAINQLSDGYKYIFIKHFYENKNYKEIAKELGISDGTVRSQVFKGKKQFKKNLESLNRLEETTWLPNPEEKQYMRSIEKNEKYSKLLLKFLQRGPLVSDVEVIEYPVDRYYETPTYKIKIFIKESEVTDIHKNVREIYNEVNYFLRSMLGGKLNLRDKITFEVEWWKKLG